jgi:transcriptional regulator with XRE-family HTH domain
MAIGYTINGILIVDIKRLGQRIRQARERQGLSQEEFAVRIARDQRAVSQYENGVRKIAVTDLTKFAEALSVPLSYFYEEEALENELDNLLLHEFHKIPSSEAKSIVIEMVRLFSKALKL